MAICECCRAVHNAWVDDSCWTSQGADTKDEDAVYYHGQYWVFTCGFCRLLIDLRHWAKHHPDRVNTGARHLEKWIERYMPNRFDPERDGFRVPPSFPSDDWARIPMDDSQIMARIKEEEAMKCQECKGSGKKGMIGKGFRKESTSHKFTNHCCLFVKSPVGRAETADWNKHVSSRGPSMAVSRVTAWCLCGNLSREKHIFEE